MSEDNLVILCLVTHQGDESLSQSDGACANPVIFGHTRGIPHENEQKTSCEVVVRAVKSSNWVDRSPAVWRARAACFVAESKLVLPASRHFAPIAPASHTGASCANGRGSPCVCSSHLLCFAALCGRSEAGKQVAYSLCTALQVYAGGGDVGSPARRHPGARRCHQALRRASAAFQIHPRFAPECVTRTRIYHHEGWFSSIGPCTDVKNSVESGSGVLAILVERRRK